MTSIWRSHCVPIAPTPGPSLRWVRPPIIWRGHESTHARERVSASCLSNIRQNAAARLLPGQNTPEDICFACYVSRYPIHRPYRNIRDTPFLSFACIGRAVQSTRQHWLEPLEVVSQHHSHPPLPNRV